jgi:uncharacterized membrane protein
MRIILILILTNLLLAPPALSLGMSDYSFGQVEQEQTYYATIPVYQSALDFENDFTIETGGELAGWLKVMPVNFSLGKGESQILNVTLTVPGDAKLGDYNGTIKAVGHRPVPGANQTGGAVVGYTVATLSKIHAMVVKPGAREIVAIENIVTPGRVSPGEIAGFSAVIRNTGNVPTTAILTLTVQQGSSKIADVPSAPMELALGEKKEVELFWKPAAEGSYKAVLTASYGGKTTNSEPLSIDVGRSVPGVQAFVVIMLILAAALLRRKL